jgi:hypothetical protein
MRKRDVAVAAVVAASLVGVWLVRRGGGVAGLEAGDGHEGPRADRGAAALARLPGRSGAPEGAGSVASGGHPRRIWSGTSHGTAARCRARERADRAPAARSRTEATDRAASRLAP